MQMSASDIIRSTVPADWTRLTPLAQNIKGKRPFKMDYSEVVRAVRKAERDGIVEIKKERAGKVGPFTVYVRKLS